MENEKTYDYFRSIVSGRTVLEEQFYEFRLSGLEVSTVCTALAEAAILNRKQGYPVTAELYDVLRKKLLYGK